MTTTAPHTPSRSKLAGQALIRLLAGVVILGGLFFLTAGTFAYWEAWLYLAALFIPILALFIYLLNNAPDALERRLRMKETQREQNVVLVLAWIVLFLAVVLPGLDKRFGWSHVPVWVVLVADAVIVLGYGLFALVMRENRYASRVIEVEEGQRVIASGPYAVVRHPMYVAILLIYMATPVALGSWVALAPALLLPFVLAFRIRTEEASLVRDLPGYDAYRQKVRYRLIPHLW